MSLRTRPGSCRKTFHDRATGRCAMKSIGVPIHSVLWRVAAAIAAAWLARRRGGAAGAQGLRPHHHGVPAPRRAPAGALRELPRAGALPRHAARLRLLPFARKPLRADREAAGPRRDPGALRLVPPAVGLDAGDVHARGRRARKLRDLPRRRKAAASPRTTWSPRPRATLPPHGRLEAGAVRSPHRESGHLRELPQRVDRHRKDRGPRADHAGLRRVPPHDRLEARHLQPRGCRARAVRRPRHNG